MAVMVLSTWVFAYEPEVKILTKDEIVKLSDSVLLDNYIEVSVEIEAATSLHATSGFVPKEYKSFKDLLRYRIELLNEIKKRKLEAPVVQQ